MPDHISTYYMCSIYVHLYPREGYIPLYKKYCTTSVALQDCRAKILYLKNENITRQQWYRNFNQTSSPLQAACDTAIACVTVCITSQRMLRHYFITPGTTDVWRLYCCVIDVWVVPDLLSIYIKNACSIQGGQRMWMVCKTVLVHIIR